MMVSEESEDTSANNKRVIKYRKDTYGHMVLPAELWFEGVDYNEVELVEDTEAKPIDWDRDPFYCRIFEQYNKRFSPNSSCKSKKKASESPSKEKPEPAETVALSDLPAGMVIVADTPFRDDHGANQYGVQHKNRKDAVSPREYMKGKIVLLQVTSSLPQENPIDHQYYDVRYDNIVDECGLKHSSTIKCAEICLLPPDSQILVDSVAGSLVFAGDTWEEVVKMCRIVPDTSIVLCSGTDGRNSDMRSDSSVIAYIVMPNY